VVVQTLLVKVLGDLQVVHLLAQAGDLLLQFLDLFLVLHIHPESLLSTVPGGKHEADGTKSNGSASAAFSLPYLVLAVPRLPANVPGHLLQAPERPPGILRRAASRRIRRIRRISRIITRGETMSAMNQRLCHDSWYPIDAVCRLTGMSSRTLARRKRAIPENCIRFAPSTLGRPKMEIHFEGLPELAVCHRSSLAAPVANDFVPIPADPGTAKPAEPKPEPAKPTPKPKGATRDDLVRGELRLSAVREFMQRCKLMSKEQAAEATCRDWANRVRCQTVQMPLERLPGGYERMTRIDVSLGTFMPGTLRQWAGAYARTKNVLALVDQKKAHVGRHELAIPEAILSYIYGLSVSTARADVAKAVAWGKIHWHGAEKWPEVSIDTWRRRLKKLSRRTGKDLNHSISKFMANCAPDVEIDWNALPYNGLWQIDDVHEDWYGMASDLEYVMRPNAYAIMRARTRKWVAFVATETPIVPSQVRELCGFAMFQPGGGLPDVFKFERGTVAGDAYLDQALATLEVRVSRTGMDGGAVVPGAFPDVATGHFQGKALIERGFRGHHDINWLVPAQVGPEEKTTAPARLQRYIKLEKDAGRNPGIIVLPTPEQWHARIAAAFEEHNNTPHSGLPEIITEAGEIRHATPNEMEQALGDQPIRRMEETLLPLFQVKGVVVPVTRNGFTINNRSYGRFDQDLGKYERVLAYASEVSPALAYVHELGRCVDLYVKASPGDSEQYGEKMHVVKARRSQHEKLTAEALASGDPRLIESMMMLSNPTPNRPQTIVAPPEMVESASRMRTAIAAHHDRHTRLDSRFVSPSDRSDPSNPSDLSRVPRAKSSRGLLSREEELSAQALVFAEAKEV
jgi:hypothetical protein